MFCALLFGLSSWASPLQAQTQSTGQICALMVDRTLSLDMEHRTLALEMLSDALPTFPHELGCSEFVAGTFTDEGPFAPRQWLQVPEQLAESDCADVEIPKRLGTAGLLSNFGGFRQHYEQEAYEACLREQEENQRHYEAQHRLFLATVREVLSAEQLTDETQTDIVGALQSFLDSGVCFVLIVTDGVDTVDGVPETFGSSGVRLVMLLVPARAVYGGRAATQAAGIQWKDAGATVLPYTVLGGPHVWDRLTREALQ